MTMIRDNYLDISKLIKNKKILLLFRVVEQHGGVLRFVGGAVRDALKGLKGFDLDLATDLSPDELVEACQEEGLKTVPIGIKFGTVGVIIDDTVLEVTSLRKDIKTDGRHAEVEFTDNWEEDASRRDLTINAVYADKKGNVFDYYNGIGDLEKGVVRFIGNAAQRIKEDYLRILRFFRFYSIFGEGEIDAKALQACVENREGLTSLSMERIRDEIFKILLTPKVVKTIQIMMDNNILGYIMPDPPYLDKLDFLVKMVDKHHIPFRALRRLFIIYQPDTALAENLAFRLRLNKKEKQLFVDLAANNIALDDLLNPQKLQQLIYRYGAEFCQEKILLQAAIEQKDVPEMDKIIAQIKSLSVPVFPLKGSDIINQGIDDQRKTSSVLKELEKVWIDSNFSLSKEELLQKRKQINPVNS